MAVSTLHRAAPIGAGPGTQVLIYGDCAVNVLPTAEELAQIAATSADTAAAFGIEPRVAMLSYSTFGSGSGPEVDKVCAGSGLEWRSPVHQHWR